MAGDIKVSESDITLSSSSCLGVAGMIVCVGFVVISVLVLVVVLLCCCVVSSSCCGFGLLFSGLLGVSTSVGVGVSSCVCCGVAGCCTLLI